MAQRHAENPDQFYPSPRVDHFRRWMCVILLVATGLRISWAIFVPVAPVSDSMAYDTFARNIAAGDGYGWEKGQLTAYWPVGTSAIYALVYSAVGIHYSSIAVLNVLIGVATTGLIAVLTSKWFGQSAAISAAIIYSAWPSQIQFTTVLASELLYNFFGLAALTAWYITPESRFSNIASGVLFAVASFVRPTALLLPFILGARDLLTCNSSIARHVVKIVTIASVMLVLILPWSIRNTLLFNEFVLLSTNGGANLWMGNNPSESIEYAPLPGGELSRMNEAQRNRELKQRAWKYILENPANFIVRVSRRFVHLNSRETIGVVWNEKGILKSLGDSAIRPLKWISTSYWLSILTLAVLGTILISKTSGTLRTILHPLVLIWVYYVLVHVVMVSQDRYHFPSIPSIASLGGIGACWLLMTSVRWLKKADEILIA